MGKVTNSAEHLLNQLGELSCQLTGTPHQDCGYFEKPLRIINEALGFHISVLYKITNVIENDVIHGSHDGLQPRAHSDGSGGGHQDPPRRGASPRGIYQRSHGLQALQHFRRQHSEINKGKNA